MNYETHLLLEEHKPLLPNPLITNLSREILPEPESGDFVPIPKQNYNRYNLFVLRTRLRVLITQKWNSEIDVKMASVEYNNRMHIKITPQIGTNPLPLDETTTLEMKKMIDIALSEPLDYAVIIAYQDLIENKIRVPGYWVKNILPYIDFPVKNKSILHRLGKYGLEVITTGEDPFGDLKTDDYILFYNQIESSVSNTIMTWYKMGVVINPSKDIINTWNLVNLKKDLYYPNWTDLRITKPWGKKIHFIQSRILGNTDLRIWVGNNLVDYHRIAKIIPNSYFSNNYLIVSVVGINQAQKIANRVDDISPLEGKVAMFKTEDKYKKDLIEIGTELGIKDIVFYHKMGLLGYDLFFSAEIGFDLSEQIVINEFKKRLLMRMVK